MKKKLILGKNKKKKKKKEIKKERKKRKRNFGQKYKNIDMSLKTYDGYPNIWKGAQHHGFPGRCKLKQ
jgi:hypothetical protein